MDNELLEYKVISNYPGSMYSVGETIRCNKNGRIYLTGTIKANPSDYPALFSLIE